MARSFRPLFVDVDPARRDEIAEALDAAGWSLTHASRRRGHRGVHRRARPARLGRRHLRRRGRRPGARAQGHGAGPRLRPAAPLRRRRRRPSAPATSPPSSRASAPTRSSRPDPARLPEVLGPILARRLEERGEGNEAYRLLLAQQAITDHVAAGLEPDELCARVLGDARGDAGLDLRRRLAAGRATRACCAAARSGTTRRAGPQVAAFAEVSRRMRIAPGRGLPGRTYAFRRPSWIARRRRRRQHAAQRPRRPRGAHHRRRLPDHARRRLRGRDRVLLRRHREPDAQIAAMFATVAGQLAQYLERRRLQADESRRVEQMLRAERDRAQRYLDVAGTMIVVLDAEGRRAAASTARAAPCSGREERDVLGHDWFELAVPKHERDAARARVRAAHGRRRGVGGRQRERGRHARRPAAHDRLAQHDPARRRRHDRGHALLGRGRHGAARRRAADHLPRLPRPAHRARQPGAARRAPQARARALAPHGRRSRAAAPRHRQLQARQRLARPPRRRRAAVPAGGPPAGVDPRHGHARPRRAATTSCSCSPTSTTTSQRAAERVAAQVVACLAEPFEIAGAEFQISASTGIARRAARRARRRGAARPRRLGDVPGQGDRPRRAGRASSPPAATRSSASRWPPGCAARSPTRSSSCTTSRSSPPTGRSRASRRCCAGTTRSAAASSPPASSSRWPRTRG